MISLKSQRPGGLPVRWSGPAWLALFLSPTAFVVLLMLWERSAVSAPPAGLIRVLFCLVPVVAVPGCVALIWFSKLSLGWRVGWLFLTLLAMALQWGLWIIVIAMATASA
jgi:hypothetical protein